MKVSYNSKTDLLYICLDPTKGELRNREIGEDIVVDLDADDRIVGIEILDASKRLDITSLLNLDYEQVA
ncbi:MAG: DUF2283 domain-containing protein [Acidobacteria bacterium]|nr:DUF2283 domain-containing protein [Acidobacteriota bacterium]